MNDPTSHPNAELGLPNGWAIVYSGKRDTPVVAAVGKGDPRDVWVERITPPIPEGWRPVVERGPCLHLLRTDGCETRRVSPESLGLSEITEAREYDQVIAWLMSVAIYEAVVHDKAIPLGSIPRCSFTLAGRDASQGPWCCLAENHSSAHHFKCASKDCPGYPGPPPSDHPHPASCSR